MEFSDGNDSVKSMRSKREEQHFDKLANHQTESWWGHTAPAGLLRNKRRAELVIAYANIKSKERVLELGCGSGFFTANLIKHIPLDTQITSIDISTKTIMNALKKTNLTNRPNLCMEAQNIENLSYDDSSFDVILGSSILHHLDLDRCLPEVFRVLRPGGRFVFAEPNTLNPIIFFERYFLRMGFKTQDMSEDERAINRFGFKRQLTSYGFVVDMIKPYDFLHPLILPPSLHNFVLNLSRLFEAIPVLREIGGSLIIVAHKPSLSH